jgi:hypothetical protein
MATKVRFCHQIRARRGGAAQSPRLLLISLQRLGSNVRNQLVAIDRRSGLVPGPGDAAEVARNAEHADRDQLEPDEHPPERRPERLYARLAPVLGLAMIVALIAVSSARTALSAAG